MFQNMQYYILALPSTALNDVCVLDVLLSVICLSMKPSLKDNHDQKVKS